MVTTKNSFKNISLLSLGLLTSLTLLSGLVLSSTKVSGTSTTANAAVTVSSACTMTGTLNTPHTATVNPGVYQANIGKTTFSVVCNDPSGFAIYAIGYTGEEYSGTNHTKLVGPNSNTITTGTATSGSTSNWAMKLESNDPEFYNMTIMNGYDSYSTIPDTYTKVAQITSSTASATPATMSSTYAAFIASDQTAGTYNGKVKYTMVHPYDSTAPEIPPATCSTPVPNITYMQEINSSNRSAVLASLTEDAPYYITDNRDNKFYCVSKLKDGNLWMLDNLRLDPADMDVQSILSSSNTNATDTSISYMLNGGGTTSDQYPTDPLNNEAWTSRSQDFFSIPMTISTYKDQTTTSYGNGSGKIGVYYNYCAASAGSYCYGNGTSAGTSTGNATEDLCPAGWRMPTGGSSGEYNALYTAYNSSDTSFRNALSTPYSGLFEHGLADDQGRYGFFWSSTREDDSYTYDLNNRIGGVYPADYVFRNYGRSLRCVLDN